MDTSDRFCGGRAPGRFCRLLVTVLVVSVMGVVNVSRAQTSMEELLPVSLSGWEITEDDQKYDRNNLYEYINGGAELYISYGFEKALSRIYSRPGQPDIIVDVFDMAASKNAFGVFSFSREIVDDTFGQGSQYTAGLLLFWKDRYYVSVLASPETPDSKKAVYELAAYMDKKIAKEGPLPEILDLLPRESLVEESVRYFFHYIWLNSHYYLADKNILNIDETTEALVAKYARGDRRLILLLVKYPDGEKAALAYDSFARYYLPELAAAPAAQIEDGTWTGCKKRDNLVVIVFNAAEEKEALQLVDAVFDN